MMKRTTHLIIAFATLVLCTSCDQAPEPAVMIVYHGGNEYNILENGDTVDQSQTARLVRYYSKNPGNASVLKAERADLYAIIAKHIDTNEHHRVVIISVEEKGRLFGLMKPREVRESVSAEKVLTYKPAAKTSATAE
jgi:hypothetical protein